MTRPTVHPLPVLHHSSPSDNRYRCSAYPVSRYLDSADDDLENPGDQRTVRIEATGELRRQPKTTDGLPLAEFLDEE
jgi:hypothetical protein